MAKTRPSVQKRAKEAARLEKKQVKAARQARRQAEKEETDVDLPEGVDPQIAGIVPGPQPIPTWEG